MSYILDALRRADSERERGAVPSLHSRQAGDALVDADDEEGERRRFPPLLWAVIGVLVLLIAVLAWQLMGARPPATVQMPTPVAVVPPTAPATVPPPALPVEPPLPVAAPQPQRAPVTAVPARVPASALPVQPKPVRPAAKQAAPASAAVAAVPERPVSNYTDLPENIRRELPQLVIGGAMYSQTPANRMLILNGQVFHEGDKVAGELVLEQIKLKSAVLAYKGYRYGINY
jgi:general secretion pathway protein B